MTSPCRCRGVRVAPVARATYRSRWPPSDVPCRACVPTGHQCAVCCRRAPAPFGVPRALNGGPAEGGRRSRDRFLPTPTCPTRRAPSLSLAPALALAACASRAASACPLSPGGKRPFLARGDVPVSFRFYRSRRKDVLSLSSSAQDGAGARRRRRLLNAGAAGAAGARRLAAGVPGSVAVSERAAASAGAGREGVLPSAGSEAVAPAGAGREAVVSTTDGASWETISVSEAGSSAASAQRGADAKAVASACLARSTSCRAAAGPQTVSARGSGAKPFTTTCHAASAACATAGSDAATALVVAGAKAVAFTYHTGPTAATSSETVSITGFTTTTTGSAAAFVELHAVDVLDIGPALAQLLRAVLPGRGAGGERCGQTGGPAVPVPLGRRDGLVSLASNVRRNIIDTGFSVDAMAASFTAKGLTLDDLVTLSGGHTIGSAHCNTFRERFQVANGSMTPVDASMNTDYANELIRACSANGAASAAVAVDCDSGSASAFDNRYFANLLEGRGLLRTDAVLVQNATTRAKVEEFARSQEGFFASWAGSYARLTSLGVKTGADGEIRRTCSSVNG
ncbi:peroxidase 18-like [Panicum miliaceum]|uniref:Peroxidase 18-like n=1 Tax=Panicum miliaceum TaxID=4540 RepID=A0A3L6PXT0_PANMI|nr:peroxidase 18-like [Panicum miliaceum]